MDSFWFDSLYLVGWIQVETPSLPIFYKRAPTLTTNSWSLNIWTKLVKVLAKNLSFQPKKNLLRKSHGVATFLKKKTICLHQLGLILTWMQCMEMSKKVRHSVGELGSTSTSTKHLLVNVQIILWWTGGQSFNLEPISFVGTLLKLNQCVKAMWMSKTRLARQNLCTRRFITPHFHSNIVGMCWGINQNGLRRTKRKIQK